MADECTRSITFNIPDPKGGPSVQVTAVEVDGDIHFTVQVLTAPSGAIGDLRALFFDFKDGTLLAGLGATGPKVTDFDTVNVIDLGNGATMSGAAAPFDVGVEFGNSGLKKDDIQLTTFVLSHPTETLTLDDIAHVEFGARMTSIGKLGGHRTDSSKLVTVAPAAPDAVDDSYNIFEDGQDGLDDPSTVPAGTVFQVLDNDTDADGDTLIITEVHDVLHGTVSIVDGDDADLLVGDAVLYTPDEDYAGEDTFTYCVTDNHGGTDFAEVTVNITAVADVPNLSYEILAGATVNEVIVRVTTSQTDADSSEFMDRIVLSGIPGDVTLDQSATYNPVDEPDQLVRDFKLTLPANTDVNFNLGITAVAKETSNGDEQTATTSVAIVQEYNNNELDTTFEANDQSIWDSGEAYTFSDERFFGVDTDWSASAGSFAYGSSTGELKAGFESDLDFNGGSIDAELPYDIDVGTQYNKTTDVLKISSSASILPGALFNTEGPEGSYVLDFIFHFYATLKAGLDFGELGTWNIIDTAFGPWDANENIIDIDSDDLVIEIDLPAGFSLTFEWPDVDVSALTGVATTTITGDDASNSFLDLGLDVDELVFTILGIPNPFDIGFDIGVAWGSIELADLDLSAAMNFLQSFTLTANSLPGIITYEDGSTAAFTFGSDIVLTNASSYDVDNDNLVEFELSLDPNASLNNDTDLGFNFSYVFDVLKMTGGYDVVFDSGAINVGPAYSISDTIPLGTVGVYDNTFALNFESETVNFSA
ncbi:Ig-like domain-containing protein [Hydrogenophaga sp. OTU3427]|uniref:Ig-like domain-containing protein n=1 Tax=Hydrogenophaga sp. OTU3427 TaxID=3043856 RepID=UPI00313CEB07